MKISFERSAGKDPPHRKAKIPTSPDVRVKGRGAELQPALNRAVNIESSHYTNASFHSQSFCSLEGRGREGAKKKKNLFSFKLRQLNHLIA